MKPLWLLGWGMDWSIGLCLYFHGLVLDDVDRGTKESSHHGAQGEASSGVGNTFLEREGKKDIQAAL